MVALFAANNEVIITNASSTVYGIYTGGTTTNTKADFLFNSVYISVLPLLMVYGEAIVMQHKSSFKIIIYM